MSNCKCASCEKEFARAKEWVEWANQGYSFYQIRVKYCDDCHKEKIQEAFKHLPKVIDVIGAIVNTKS